jgi:hypothetical protein
VDDKLQIISISTAKRLLPALCFISFLVQCVAFSWSNGQTVDETFYNGSGYPIVRYNDYSILGEHPPLIMQLASLPLLFLQPNYPIDDRSYVGNTKEVDVSKMGSRFLYQSGNDAHLLLFLERLVIIALAFTVALVLFQWANRLYGRGGGILAATLYCFSPNIISHGSQYTTDLGITAFFFFSLYRMYLFFEMPKPTNGLWIGICCGLAIMSKISAILLFPILLFLLVAFWVQKPSSINLHLQNTKALDRFLIGSAIVLFVLTISEKVAFVGIAPLCLLVFLLVWKGGSVRLLFLPTVFVKIVLTITILSLCTMYSYMINQKHDALLAWAAFSWIVLVLAFCLYLLRAKNSEVAFYLLRIFLLVWFISCFIVALLYTDILISLRDLNPFHHIIRAFKIASHHSLSGHGDCVTGSFVTCDWTYFSKSMLVKTPMITVMLSLVGLAALTFSTVPRMTKLIILIPIIVYFFFASLVNQIYIGVRHVLPIYPLLFLSAAACIPMIAQVHRPIIQKTLIGLIVIMTLLSCVRVLMTTPNHATYFSEWVGSVKEGVNLVRVNIGQDNRRLAETVHERGIKAIRISNSMHNTDEMNYFGVPWAYLRPQDYIEPQPGFYALDLRVYQNEQRKATSWFRERVPDLQSGSVFYLFNVKKNESGEFSE